MARRSSPATGARDAIFSSENFRANLARYPRWLWDTQGPLVFLFVLSPLLPPGPNPDSRWLRRILFAFAGGVLACYLWYLPFDAWWFLRFLLPAFPVLFVLAADVVWHGSRRFGVRTQIAAAIAFTVIMVNYAATRASELDVVGIGAGEQKYADVGRYLAAKLPANAVVIAMQHSGSHPALFGPAHAPLRLPRSGMARSRDRAPAIGRLRALSAAGEVRGADLPRAVRRAEERRDPRRSTVGAASAERREAVPHRRSQPSGDARSHSADVGLPVTGRSFKTREVRLKPDATFGFETRSSRSEFAGARTDSGGRPVFTAPHLITPLATAHSHLVTNPSATVTYRNRRRRPSVGWTGSASCPNKECVTCDCVLLSGSPWPCWQS